MKCPCAHHAGIRGSGDIAKFILLLVDGAEWSASRFDRSIPREREPVPTE